MVASISILIFWTAFFTALTTQRFWLRYDDPVTVRLGRLIQSESKPLPTLLAAPADEPGTKHLRETLLLAGLKQKGDLERAILFKRICLLVPMVITATLFFLGLPINHVFAIGATTVFVFILIPRLIILQMIFKRRREIERNLPDALDLLILCLEAGLSFDSSLVRVAEEIRRVSTHISREFMSVNHEIMAGGERAQALKNLSWRCGVQDLTVLIGSILQSTKLGTSLVKTLRIQADVIRKKRRERIRAQILKTPVKLIFPLLFFIFPTLLVVILGPSLINIFRHLNQVGS